MAYAPSITKSDIYNMRRQAEKEGKLERARELYHQGMSLYEISDRVNLPERVLVTELGLE